MTKDEALKMALKNCPYTDEKLRGAFYEGCIKVLDELEMPIDRGAWADVPDATKWVDELRGDDDLEEPPNSTTDFVEPVAWIVPDYGFLFPNEDSAQRYLDNIESNAAPTPLYTAPPKREWVGLTYEEIRDIHWSKPMNEYSFARAIEDKLREKNQ